MGEAAVIPALLELTVLEERLTINNHRGLELQTKEKERGLAELESGRSYARILFCPSNTFCFSILMSSLRR